MTCDKKVIERPQHMIMRVALGKSTVAFANLGWCKVTTSELSDDPEWFHFMIGIHGKDLDAALETYDLMSRQYFTHATPTLYNAGTPNPQLSSCFLLTMKEDSIDGIYDTLKVNTPTTTISPVLLSLTSINLVRIFDNFLITLCYLLVAMCRHLKVCRWHWIGLP